MSAVDNIELPPVATKAAHRVKRLERSKVRSREWREERRRAKAPTQAAVAEAMLLCLLDVQTVPPSRRGARGEVILDVLRQARGTLIALGHPEVDETLKQVIAAFKSRLRTERWHHPLYRTPQKLTSGDTPVTGTVRHPYRAAGIADPARNTDEERAT